MIERILNRAARELVDRFGVAAPRVAYRHVPAIRAEDTEHRVIDPATPSVAPLPRNVESRDDLSRDRGVAGFSFHDVPSRIVRSTLLGVVRRCRVLIAHDEWGDRHYAILTEDRRSLHIRGMQFQRSLHLPLVDAPGVRISSATWILEAWDRNYAHWLQWHLTKIQRIEQLGHLPRVLLPPRQGFVEASLKVLGASGLVLPGNVLDVDELTFLEIDAYRPSLLRDLRERIAPAASRPTRRVFISRRKAPRRRLLNEDRCWEVLRAHGFERVVMEDLSFVSQVALMRETAAVVALHGAGLANILFAGEGTDVVEIVDPTYANPQYYALSCAMGHRYWLVPGQVGGAVRPGTHDVVADEDELQRVLAALDAPA